MSEGSVDGPGHGVGGAVDVDGEEPASMFPEEGPDDLSVGVGHGESADVAGVNPFEAAFIVFGFGDDLGGVDFVEEHEPVGFALVGGFGDDAGESDGVVFEVESGFLTDFAEGALFGALAGGGVEFPAYG